MDPGRDRATMSAFVLGAVLAGGNGVAIRFSNRELDPLWGAGLRFALASVLLAGLLVALRLFLLYLFVLGRWLASRAAYSFVLIPIVTVLLLAWLDDEPVGWGLVLGGALVLGGVYVGALREPARDVEVAEAAS